MPDCTVGEVPFSKLGRRDIDVRFDVGAVSSDGGFLLLRRVEKRLGLLKLVAEILPDSRSPLLVKHKTAQLLRQRVFGLCQGYEDLNDHDTLRDDPALQTALERDTAAASSPTLCRFENRAERAPPVSWRLRVLPPATDELVRTQWRRLRHWPGQELAVAQTLRKLV